MSRYIPKKVEKAVRRRDGDICRGCGRRSQFLQKDHITPYKYGGPATVENIQMLCAECNSFKKDKVDHCSCGSWLPHDAKLCPQCGVRLTNRPLREQHKQTITETTKTKDRQPLIKNSLVRVVLFVAAIILLFVGLTPLVLGAFNEISLFISNSAPVRWFSQSSVSSGCVAQGLNNGNVNVRKDCNVKDCIYDESTRYAEISTGTRLEKRNAEPIQVRNTTWIPIFYQSQDLWISSKVINCDY